MMNSLGLHFSNEDREQAEVGMNHERSETGAETLLDTEDLRRRISASSSRHSSQKHSSQKPSPQPSRGRALHPPYSRGSPRSGIQMLDDERRRVHEATIEPQGAPNVIPPASLQRSRTLVLMFDGTGDQFDDDNSNLVQLMTALYKDDRTQQMVYYQVCLLVMPPSLYMY